MNAAEPVSSVAAGRRWAGLLASRARRQRSRAAPASDAHAVMRASAAPPATAADTTPPRALTLVQSNTRVQRGSPGLGQNSLDHPWLTTAAAGGSAAQSDASAGVVRTRSADIPSAMPTYADGNTEWLFQNTGPVAIAFGAGASQATVNASFLHTLETDAAGTASHILTARPYRRGGGPEAGPASPARRSCSTAAARRVWTSTCSRTPACPPWAKPIPRRCRSHSPSRPCAWRPR